MEHASLINIMFLIEPPAPSSRPPKQFGEKKEALHIPNYSGLYQFPLVSFFTPFSLALVRTRQCARAARTVLLSENQRGFAPANCIVCVLRCLSAH